MFDKVVPKEGPRAPLFYAVALIFAVSAAEAQDAVPKSELERCAGLATSAEKLACFESLSSVEDVDEAEPEDVQGASAAPEAPPVTAAEAVEADAMEETAPADGSSRSADVPVAGPELGSEHLKKNAPEDTPDVVRARVSEVWKEGNRHLYFRFTNGQVWRQMEPGYFYYPRNEEFDVTIRQGMMGDYQMRLEGRARTTRIVRVE